jgi:hypothetical protein
MTEQGKQRNRYMQQKLVNELIALARQFFKQPQYAKEFTVIAMNQMQDASGKNRTIEIEMQVPGNPKALHTSEPARLRPHPTPKPRGPRETLAGVRL